MTPTVDQVLDEAIRRIDEAFGVGSAEDNRQCYPARQRGGFNKFELTRERDAAVAVHVVITVPGRPLVRHDAPVANPG